MMKIFFLVLGTRGDLEIFLKLASELQDRGHRIIFGTSVFYQERVCNSGLRWCPIGDGKHSELLELLHSLSTVKDKLKRSQIFGHKWLKSELSKAKKYIALIGECADYFISNLHITIKRSGEIIPGAAVSYDPPDTLKNLKNFNEYHGKIINLVAINRLIIDPQNKWGKDFHFTGFWLDQSLCHWEVSSDLRAFLDSGMPPIIFTMGSMVMFDCNYFINVIIQALHKTQQRGVIIGGWSDSAKYVPPSNNIYFSQEIPYKWLFPRAACVVHHGGVGTISEVLRAGKPSIILPQVQCQSDFGEILMRENLATGNFELDTLNSEDLANSIQDALHNPIVNQSIQNWQTVIQSDPGVKGAAKLIEAHWQQISS